MSGARTPAITESRILVVDDEPANIALLEGFLGRIPEWRVVGVTSSARAVDRFAEVRPDLVLLDLHMPAPDGFTLLLEIREHLPDYEYLPILVLTADVTRETRERALALGASDFLTKPLDTTEVVLRSRNLLEARALHRHVAGEQQRLAALVRERTRALEEALADARAANAAKDQFIANMGHELRTPLTAIRGAAGLLSGPLSAELPGRARALVETTARNATRLERLVEDILLLQSLQSGSVRPASEEVQVGDLLAELLRERAAEVSAAGLELRTLFPPELQPARTDRGLLAQLLERLIGNALRYTTEGVVTVEIAATGEPPRPVAITVTDTGPGIPAERREAVFSAFEQVDNSDTRRHGGLGVGLAIARALCDALGCTLALESEVGRGTSVRVGLPDAPSYDGTQSAEE